MIEPLGSLGHCKNSLQTFKIGHICPDIGVQRIHHHLSIRGPGDLHSSINQPWGGLCSLPRIILSDMLCLREKIGKRAFVELCLTDNTTSEEFFSRGIEGSMEESEERNSFFAQNLLVEIGDGAGDINALEDRFRGSHLE